MFRLDKRQQTHETIRQQSTYTLIFAKSIMINTSKVHKIWKPQKFFRKAYIQHVLDKG